MPSRRDVLKLTSAATAGILMSASGVALAESTKPKIKAAGYPYDRVQAIKDGRWVSIRLMSVFIMKTSTA